ncbi:uncharacterized protein MYCFIDRAFT_178447 [Pseudocercospora fijiensis CIRAD86]|uniref:Uncharacterized protein n=1 Tax=Pseudocercospora fijiensis (strain CIRAD86) TaxID=383855 RepID=M3ALI4_PSEFD|nr:uncharacterized protein MYCFIDRAFT_178447 [Pseudocercospora fijiensis CIRAD86]EME78287.1 hypothetical protein MYCFIDRAFT_178447 [Pseudocercospora fijiensis CIRAD86]
MFVLSAHNPLLLMSQSNFSEATTSPDTGFIQKNHIKSSWWKYLVVGRSSVFLCDKLHNLRPVPAQAVPIGGALAKSVHMAAESRLSGLAAAPRPESIKDKSNADTTVKIFGLYAYRPSLTTSAARDHGIELYPSLRSVVHKSLALILYPLHIGLQSIWTPRTYIMVLASRSKVNDQNFRTRFDLFAINMSQIKRLWQIIVGILALTATATAADGNEYSCRVERAQRAPGTSLPHFHQQMRLPVTRQHRNRKERKMEVTMAMISTTPRRIQQMAEEGTATSRGAETTFEPTPLALWTRMDDWQRFAEVA